METRRGHRTVVWGWPLSKRYILVGVGRRRVLVLIRVFVAVAGVADRHLLLHRLGLPADALPVVPEQLLRDPDQRAEMAVLLGEHRQEGGGHLGSGLAHDARL